MAKIGIYGGTFNPIHKTHIEIARAALKQYDLDRLIFLIAGDPPHKATGNAVTAANRVDMVNLAISKCFNFEIDTRELYRAGKSYSYLTLTEYHLEHPDDELFFIMGSDSLLQFKNWVKPETISAYATILAAPRTGDDLIAITSCLSDYRKTYDGDFKLIEYQANAIASTSIREGVHNDKDIKSLLPDVVLHYIEEHNLYREIYDYDIVCKLLNEMKLALKPGRYIHTVGVANTAYNLAIKWNYPAYNAMVAGVLHDCAKCISDDKRLEVCSKNGIEISDIEKKFPHLLHGKVGALYCKSKYDIWDEQISHAISIHTTGCPGMNLLDKIIFVADYIEPGRNKQPRLDDIRKVAFEDLDLCVFMILEDTVNYLNENPESIDITTLDTYNFYKKMREV